METEIIKVNFTETEKLDIIRDTKEIFLASIKLTYREMEKGNFEEALRLAKITQITGVNLLGLGSLPGVGGIDKESLL